MTAQFSNTTVVSFDFAASLGTAFTLKHVVNAARSHAGETDYTEHFFFTGEEINPIRQLVKKEILLCTGSGITIYRHGAGWPPRTSRSDAKHLHNQLPDNPSQMCISKYRYGNTIPIELICEREL